MGLVKIFCLPSKWKQHWAIQLKKLYGSIKMIMIFHKPSHVIVEESVLILESGYIISDRFLSSNIFCFPDEPNIIKVQMNN